MTRLIITLCMSVLMMSIQAQSLLDLYKKGNVKLVPDTEYAVGNDWNTVFETYNDTLYGKWMGNRKSIKVLPDGSVVVNHAYHNYYSKFSPKGTFQKEFKVIGQSGKSFKKTQAISGIINENTFFTGLDNLGNMLCFDFDGNYKKTLKLDYMSRQEIALPNGKIAVVGWVIWAEKFRDFVAIVDYETNEEKVIWEHYTDRCNEEEHCKLFHYSYQFEKGGSFSFRTMPFSNALGLSSPPEIACVNNQLVLAMPGSGDIKVFSLEGELQDTYKINWTKNYLTIEEQKEIQQKAIDGYQSMDHSMSKAWSSEKEQEDAIQGLISQMKADLDKITDPLPKPTFSTILKDSDDNLLFFEFPEEENKNIFNVWIYQRDGSFVCKSSLVCDDYNLQINPSKLVFHNGYLYGLQTKKDVDGIPLRLVRFKLASE
ncbi:hypothetical protein [Carboxylicivirga linearis]|uniref:6-bladed beta-propeller n=1 Tax=Carboxylicivirga linearis TaxID=1628157 RepID=A0ABS5JRD7_9BACT|nr:hypothetical protein [Carboxylicivirga linearis]MBS2097458.1 hypothetical protein [Carboxylicivirga linearis]